MRLDEHHIERGCLLAFGGWVPGKSGAEDYNGMEYYCQSKGQAYAVIGADSWEWYSFSHANFSLTNQASYDYLTSAIAADSNGL